MSTSLYVVCLPTCSDSFLVNKFNQRVHDRCRYQKNLSYVCYNIIEEEMPLHTRLLDLQTMIDIYSSSHDISSMNINDGY